ncbi:MAG TPA: hypothetical protein VLT91_08915 [Rhizomicrobium sp.]|nr:hypothetical protein [Rhizomicrobium sp.]
MNFAIFAPKRLTSIGAVILCAVGLSGCFDLGQKVAIGRDGSGGYAISVAADGIVGEGISRHHADIDIDDDMPLHTRVAVVDGKTVQTSGTAFRDLSDLRLSDETISLHVKGQKLLGLAGTQVNFHRSFNIDRARRHHDEDSDDHLGREILTSMFGDHAYTFSVWLPGSIDHINPLYVGNREVKPVVSKDGEGHTITWRMKLTDMFLADTLDFDVDFTAHGNFHDTQTQFVEHHHNHHHHWDET